MGLSKSKSKERKDEEQKKTPTHSVSKAEDKTTEEAEQADKETLNQSSDNLLGSGSSRHLRPSVSFEEKPDAKQKASKKKTVVPQIIITPASTETLMTHGPPANEEQRTIREQTGWGPY